MNNRHRSAARAYEREAFETFLRAYPSFAAEVADWDQPENDPPDVVVKLKTGGEVPFELAEWLHEEQISQRARLERLQKTLDAVIGGRPPNETKHIRFLSLKPREDVRRFDRRDAVAFREELFRLISEMDQRREDRPGWLARPTATATRDHLRRYPALATYLERVLVDWRTVNGQPKETWVEDWVGFAPWGGFYDEQSALDALTEIIAKKVSQYGASLDPKTRLLVYYNKAVVYNTPYVG